MTPTHPKDVTTREDDREQPERQADAERDEGYAPVRDDEHDGGFGDGPLL